MSYKQPVTASWGESRRLRKHQLNTRAQTTELKALSGEWQWKMFEDEKLKDWFNMYLVYQYIRLLTLTGWYEEQVCELYTLWTRASSRTYLVKTLLCCKWSNVFQLERGCQLKSQCNRKESLRRIWKLYSYSLRLLLCQSKVFLVSNKIGLVKWAFLVMWGRPPLRETNEGRFDPIPANQRAIAVTVNQNATWWFPSRTGMENSR